MPWRTAVVGMQDDEKLLADETENTSIEMSDGLRTTLLSFILFFRKLRHLAFYFIN